MPAEPAHRTAPVSADSGAVGYVGCERSRGTETADLRTLNDRVCL